MYLHIDVTELNCTYMLNLGHSFIWVSAVLHLTLSPINSWVVVQPRQLVHITLGHGSLQVEPVLTTKALGSHYQ